MFSRKKIYTPTPIEDPEFKAKLEKYREELITVLHKSQDSFEKQLSYISAGSLALSIGFIKDVVKNISSADHKWVLNVGWGFLAFTLLINCISHIRAADLHNRTIQDINLSTYNPLQISQRYKEVSVVNWISVVTLILGLSSIIFFVSKNILK